MQSWRLCRRLILLSSVLAGEALAQTGLIVSPTEIALAVQSGSATPATAVIAIATPGQNVPFSVSVRHLGTAGNWLSVNPMSGMTPANVTATASGSMLSAGIYQAQIVISAGSFGRVVNVALTVGAGGGAGSFGVSPTALTFVALPGTTELAPQTISIQTPANVGFRAVATSSGWLTVNPLTGTTPGGISVEVFSAGLASARYSGTVAIYPLAGGAPTIVPVTLVVAGSTADDRLRLNRLALNVNHQVGSVEPPAHSITVSTLNSGRSFTAATATPWIQLRTIHGTLGQIFDGITPASVEVFTRPSQLGEGTYAGTVTFSSAGLPSVELPVTLRVSGQAALNANPSSVVFDETYGFEPQLVTVTSTSSALSFVAAVSGGNWLRVSPSQASASSSNAATLTLTVEPGGLRPDTYTASVVLAAQNGSTLTIPVRLEITTPLATAGLQVAPGAISLTSIVGDINPVQVLSVGSDDIEQHPFTAMATSEGGWLTIDPTSGVTPGRVGVTARLANVPRPGIYSGLVVITSLLTGTQYEIPVSLNLLDQVISVEPAAVAFPQPRRGAEAPPQSIRVNAPVPVRFEIMEKPDWVRVSQSFGNTPATIQLWATVSVTPPGTSGSRIRIAGPKNEVIVPVTFQAAEPAAATVTPESVALRYSVGQPALPTQTLEIASGGEPGPFKVAVATESGAQWLRADPTSGTTPGTVRLTIDPLLLAPGRYTATVTITVDNGAVQTRTVPVELLVGSPTASVQSVLHAATLAPTAVVPGQIITILGTGLGPLLGIAARPNAAGAYETRLSDTRVLFDNTAAPILFLNNDQINAIVPYSVFGRFSTTMRIEQGSNWSLPLELRVVEAAPAVFTANGSGRGQAAAVNADWTPNSQSNSAARGSVISIYVTGEGQTDPPGNDGRVILTDLRRPILPVSVRIGGRTAEVVYAGSAPMQVSGMMQVNARIPDDIQPGVVPLEVQVGSAVSQPAVTIAVR